MGRPLLAGRLADQAALRGLLAAIRDLGFSLISVETCRYTGIFNLSRVTPL